MQIMSFYLNTIYNTDLIKTIMEAIIVVLEQLN